jgi:hypothetical protein
MVEWYWAELRLSAKEITFYTEDQLRKEGIFDTIKKMQDNSKEHQEEVNISEEDKRKLKAKGIELFESPLGKPNMPYLALKGVWHWFTGYSSGDFIRLKPEIERELREKGSLTVYFG